LALGIEVRSPVPGEVQVPAAQIAAEKSRGHDVGACPYASLEYAALEHAAKIGFLERSLAEFTTLKHRCLGYLEA